MNAKKFSDAMSELDNIEIVWKFKDFLTTSEGEAK